jgi:hypothetical protein
VKPKFNPDIEFKAAARHRNSRFSVERVLQIIEAERRESRPPSNMTMLAGQDDDSMWNHPALSTRRRRR